LIWVVAVLSVLPSLLEGYALLWGARQGYTGAALRDGLDFWAGGTLALHHHAATVFDPTGYGQFIEGKFGAGLPIHMWSYPPSYLLLAAAFGWLPAWPAVLAFDAASLLLLIFLLRLAEQPWLFVLAVAASPVALENLLEGQNAALITALIGGGLLLLRTRPHLSGVLIGLAAVKPQLGLPLPLYLIRSPAILALAAAFALGLGLAALAAFGPGAWIGFWQVTRPAMSNVLLTGKPAAFAGGLVSVFAAARLLGVPAALVIQGLVSAGAMLLAARTRNPAVVLILCALASPYLHDYDLLGVALAVALLVMDRLQRGFAPGEAVLFFLAWAGPGALPWLPRLAHATPLILLLLLATAIRRDRLTLCDSAKPPNFLPASSAGP
jgi:hypothetical protein